MIFLNFFLYLFHTVITHINILLTSLTFNIFLFGCLFNSKTFTMYTAHCTVSLNTFFSLNASVCPSVPCSELCSVFLSFTSRGSLYTCYYLCSFQAFFRLSWIFFHAPPYSCFDNLCFTLLLKRSYIVYFQCLFVLFTLVVNCLWCSHSSDLFALLLCQWKYCFSPNKTIDNSSIKFITSRSSSSPLSFLSLCFHLLTSHSVFAFSANHYPPPLPSLAALMQFHPQRWRADSYNYPSVCEMNHWAADWAAWWETSIVSSTTECSQPSTPSFCWCPGLVHTYSLPLLRKTGCGLQPLHAVAETMTWKYSNREHDTTLLLQHCMCYSIMVGVLCNLFVYLVDGVVILSSYCAL